MSLFVYISTVLFAFLFVVWSRKTLLNFVLKFIFLAMLIAGVIFSGRLLGWF